MQFKNKQYNVSTARGFTIVELLIVIVVIGILAAITIVAFNGVSSRAAEASMQSDLSHVATAVEADKVLNGTYPADAGSANNGSGLKASGGNTLSYVPKSYGYCASVSSTGSSKTYTLKSGGVVTEGGTCDVLVELFAGSGTAGAANGTGAAAQFNGPNGTAVGTDGTVYIADSSNHRIRKISPAGVVTTLAGSGTAGNANGTGTAAQFNFPQRLAVDSANNVYVADVNNHRVRKITPAGVVTTLAGSSRGYLDDTGTFAFFNEPRGVAVDGSGNVYVADSGNARVRKITPTGVVTTLAGSGTSGEADGTGTGAQFSTSLQGITVSAAGDVYLADYDNSKLRKITSAGVVTTLTGWGMTNYIYHLMDVQVDPQGTIYIAAAGEQHGVYTLSSAGTMTLLFGGTGTGYANGTALNARFDHPGIGLDATNGFMYVSDRGNRVRKVTL